jgi:hypothetical protein
MTINLHPSKRNSLPIVGRERELAVLKQSLGDPSVRLVHISGPGGMGKTTLLRLFQSSMEPNRCYYLDGHGGFRTPDDFLKKLNSEIPKNLDGSSIAEHLNRLAAECDGIVLLLDTFELWEAIEGWLQVDFLADLNPNVKLLIAGRNPLGERWKRFSSLDQLVQEIELQPLAWKDVQAYALKKGIASKEIISSLQHFSKGVPLALSMACEIIIRKGETRFLNKPEQTQIYGYLAEQLTKGMENDASQRYAEAASVVWIFDQELLQAMLQEHIPTAQFRDFIRQPFVIRYGGRWAIHDSIRQWIYTDLRSRMPLAFQAYRRVALGVLRERERNPIVSDQELTFEKIYLHEHDLIRNVCYLWDDAFEIKECEEHQIQDVQELYLNYLKNDSIYIQGDAHLETLIPPLWRMDPRDFIGLWKEDRLVAFCSCIPLNKDTVQVFRSNPITAAATTNYTEHNSQFITCIAGLDRSLEEEIAGAVMRALVRMIDRNGLLIHIIPMPKWTPLLPLLGFERAPWADSCTEMGVVYQGYQLDLRKEPLSMRIDRLLSSLVSTENVEPANKSKLPLEQAIKLVQYALKHYSRLPLHPELSIKLRPLLNNQDMNEQTVVIAQQLQNEIEKVLQRFSTGSNEENRYYQILNCAYIRKIGTHETVAEHLNMSSPTYYRSLRMAVRKLAFELIQSGNG